ncbi:hypothetical protein ACH4OW_14770 [Streptomyces sp. NPDC017056]|uniref:hypothetical protein n=1 Tax=Streptomyces sp. NPDC017056 TaxID=3364973 RepID=UPI0037AEC0C1
MSIEDATGTDTTQFNVERTPPSIEDVMNTERNQVQRELDAWDLEAFVAKLGQRIAVVQQQPRRQRHTKTPQPPRPAPSRPTPSRPGRGNGPSILRPPVHSEWELQRLCEDAVTVPEVRALLERFLIDFDPCGARVFACLLYLADRADHALFWWRFASGAEDGLAAYCMALHSSAVGEKRQLSTWTRYIRDLAFDPARHWPQPKKNSTITSDTRRLSNCVQTNVRAASIPDSSSPAIMLPTADLPRELVSL